MQNFQNILFVSKGNVERTEALKQALWLANSTQVPIKILILCPEFSGAMSEYKEKFEQSIRDQFQSFITKICDELKIDNKQGQINIDIEYGSTPVIRIIRHVLRNQHDLVIKDVEAVEKGFKSIDMELLRKCPCAVWLCRPNVRANLQKGIHLAVAIDAESEEQSAHDLSLRLLKLSHSLADTYGEELNVVSCWDYELEDYLRHNLWVNMPEEKLQNLITEVQTKNHHALDSLIKESKISGKINIGHFKGLPDQVIPNYVLEKNIDLLIMGTVSRTGIQGFLIGNTAENVVQKINCSLLALKPNGFVSSVKAY
ncbi:universal stress protein [Candidatus Berkiella cookevillensis]|uniref:Universal stress protein n=1 Tax=Candidatus Berkiella cookevillensis TaxID=437022 RepID=A0A0Q9YP29_9GAMM|nr:universal stress protein [Candidatus Berkiella cookevillensis]MCS5707911.1 universal stress protein [Candidatus Berkiella cookevillensis]